MHETTKKNLIKFGLGLMATVFIITILIQEYNIQKMTSKSSVEKFAPLLDSYINAEMNVFDIPGASIAIIRDSTIVWEKAYGFADIENNVKMTSDTICRVQSISKPVTAWGIMKLVEKGQLELEKPIGQYIKSMELPEELKEATIRQLLSHTSGLALGDVMKIYSPLEDKPTLEENLEKEISVIFDPGIYSYSNVGFNLLELLIEDVTGRDFAEYMENEVLKPLGMRRSTFDWNPKLNVPSGYGLSGKPMPVYVYPEKASGGLFATAGDIALFSIAGMNNPINEYKVISKDSINSMYSPATGIRGIYSLVFDAYGLGYFLENPDSGILSVSHGGQGTGIMTHMQYSPETGDGIVILTNSQRSWPFIAAVLGIWARWNGSPQPGMTVILLGRSILYFIVIAGFLAIFMMVWKLMEELIRGKRSFISNIAKVQWLQIIQLLGFIILFGSVVWNISRPYSNLTSIFPVISVWIHVCLFAMAVCILLYALLPERK